MELKGPIGYKKGKLTEVLSMSYEFYKILHFVSIIFVFSFLAVNYFHPNPPKFAKIVNGISSFLVLVAGMGLLARIGVAHGQGFPKWVWIKIIFWLALVVLGPIGAKRLKPEHKTKAFFGLILIGCLNIIVAVVKP